MIWMVMSGRGFGKSLVGSTWLTKQAQTHPNSEWAVFAPTFRDVRKTCIEGETGLLAALDIERDVAHYRRNELQIILNNGSVIYGYSADQPERARGANLWGAWCVAENEPVVTERGDVPIRDVRPGDRVMTRGGWRTVTAAARTRRNAATIRITTDRGAVRCTPDHPVWVDGRGWVRADSVAPGDTMLSWRYASLQDRPRTTTGTASAGTATRGTATTATAPAHSCTTPCGHTSTAPSPTGATSTTKTTTAPTTCRGTCNCSPKTNTGACTPTNGAAPANSTTPNARSTASAPVMDGPVSSRATTCANSAATHSSPGRLTSSSADRHAVRATAVLSVANDSACDVYDLTVDGAHEFFAGGLLVHNCDELGSWRYETTWHEGLVPALRKGKNPRIVVTTTPRPTRLIKDLTSRKDGSVHITRGSTWENARNLAPSALAELKRRYEGTRIGRQELEGELLEDIEGALWTRSNIDADRVKLSEVPDLTRVVVAIDPAVTSNEDSDESGIVVVGHTGDQGYVLGDYSMIGTPNEVIKKAITAYQIHNADKIVAEVNNGGDWIGALLRTVDTNIPYGVVRASRGKAIRAEPVSSLYEQHRMHHVGSFPELEDQMCGFVPGVTSDSPDRMDALVWAATELSGMVAGDWNDAYGTIKCFTCAHVYVLASHTKCPKCGTMN